MFFVDQCIKVEMLKTIDGGSFELVVHFEQRIGSSRYKSTSLIITSHNHRNLCQDKTCTTISFNTTKCSYFGSFLPKIIYRSLTAHWTKTPKNEFAPTSLHYNLGILYTYIHACLSNNTEHNDSTTQYSLIEALSHLNKTALNDTCLLVQKFPTAVCLVKSTPK